MLDNCVKDVGGLLELELDDGGGVHKPGVHVEFTPCQNPLADRQSVQSHTTQEVSGSQHAPTKC